MSLGVLKLAGEMASLLADANAATQISLPLF